jgi:hypothetical protein
MQLVIVPLRSRRRQLVMLGCLKGSSFSLCSLQAFKSYDEAGVSRRVQCLKYLVLASMLMESNVRLASMLLESKS